MDRFVKIGRNFPLTEPICTLSKDFSNPTEFFVSIGMRIPRKLIHVQVLILQENIGMTSAGVAVSSQH